MTESVFGAQPPTPSKDKTQKTISQQDIQEFVQVQEEIKQLEALLTVAQNMNQQQIQKGRQKKANLAFNFEKLPMQGNAEQQGNIGTFNSLQPLIATEIQSLAKQVTILKSGNPSLASELDPFLDKLEGMAKSFPHFSQKQIDSLNTMVNMLHDLANHASGKTQSAFWQEVGNMYQNMYTTNKKALDDYQSQAKQPPSEAQQGAQKTANNLGAMQDQLGAASAGAAAKATASGSLPNLFQQAILHHYMPNQETYLLGLAEVLAFDNLGADMGNGLYNLVTQFADPSNSFSLNQWLQGKDAGDGKYNGTATDANNNISTEKNAAHQAHKSLKKTLSQIKNDIKSIKHNKSITKTHQKELEKQLKGFEKDIKAAKKQTETLYKLLSHMHAQKVDSKHFKITDSDSNDQDWAKKLPAYENIVANGASASQAAQWNLREGGGLSNVYQEIKSFQGNYAGLAQNQQMKLQMAMTEIQQEWTVVSTALQLLNQMYMSVAQGIYH